VVEDAIAGASIAVLPFADLSPEGDQEYFGDGIAEELLNVLASIDELEVASRTSAFAFKEQNRNVSEIANILSVTYVLEGSVRKASDSLRITAQLIDAASDRHLWSDTFDRELTADNIFAIQDEIAKSIVGALDSELALGVGDSVDISAATGNLDAYELYLQARQLGSIKSAENAKQIVDVLERAVELDAEFAEAWGLLAASTTFLPTWDHSLEPEPYHRRAIEVGQRALRLDPANSDAHVALASAFFSLYEWESYRAAVGEAYRVVPNYVENPEGLMGLGYLEQAYDLATKHSAKLPDEGYYDLLQGLYFNHMRQFRQAIPKFQNAILRGYIGGAEFDLASAYLSLGDNVFMTAILSREYDAYDPELLVLLPHIINLMSVSDDGFTGAASRFRIIARELGFTEEDLVQPGPRFGPRTPNAVALAYARMDVVTDRYWGNSPMFWMWTPYLQPWRRSESFRERVRDTGMLAYWQNHGWPDLCQPVGEDDFECD
jgi:TolB-like protein